MVASATQFAMKPRRRRWLLLLGSTLVALLVCEVAARLAIRHWNEAGPQRPTAGGDVMLVEMLQPSPHRSIVYALQPGLDVRFQGVAVTTNAAGFRGPELPASKPAGGFRVVALGDSVLFGWGVGWDDTGIARLPALLSALRPGRYVDAIGTGVPGYNTAIEAEVLAHHGLAWQPDVVVVDFVGNDLDLPNFLLAPQDWWRLDHCFLVDLGRRVWRSSWLDPRTPFVWAPGDGQGHFESDPERVPAEYRAMVGIDGYRRAMTAIAAMGRQHGFRVLVTTQYGLPSEVAAVCTELALPTVSIRPRIDAFLQGGGSAAALQIAPDDPHPTAMVHGFWAEAVAAKLAELGWLPP